MQTGKDLEMLGVLAESRLATVGQLVSWMGVSQQMARRRAVSLAGLGLVESWPRTGGGQRRGRPEWVYSLSSRGVEALREVGTLPTTVAAERVTAGALMAMVEHQLLLNEVSIRCRQLDRAGTAFRTRFLSSTSPFHLSAAASTVLADYADFPDGGTIDFIPDAAFSISHAGVGKSLLFFLEVDMGTETVRDPKDRWDRGMWGKVVVYRSYFVRKRYKRYESDELLGAPFHGFRLLMVCASTQRTRAISHMVVKNQPSSFVWIAAAPDLLRKGLGAHVWRPGGDRASWEAWLPHRMVTAFTTWNGHEPVTGAHRRTPAEALALGIGTAVLKPAGRPLPLSFMKSGRGRQHEGGSNHERDRRADHPVLAALQGPGGRVRNV